MEKRKKDFVLLFAAIALMILGTVGIVFALDDPLSVSTVTVQASSGGSSTTAALTVITDENVTTAGIDTNAYIDTDILIKFNQNLTNDDNNKSKINLQKIKSDGSLSTTALIENSGITIYNKNLTINPTDNLSANTCYLVTVSPGVTAATADVNSTTYQAIFKTGTESQSAASATFSAIMTSPATTGDTVNEAVDKNSAVFSFEFSEIVKNNGITGAISLTKVSGGSAAVASDGAVIVNSASTTAGSDIYLASLGTSGSTTAAFTINPSILENSATYELKLKSTATSLASKTLGADQTYTFTTTAGSAAPTVTLGAIYLNPVSNAKDIAVDADLLIGFTKEIAASNNITNGKAIELLDTATGTTLPAIFALSDDKKYITVNPNADLTYGKQYQLKIIDGKISDGTNVLPESSVSFTTTCFSQVHTSGTIEGASGASITTVLTSAKDQNFKISYVVRRDKGARLAEGGTVVLSSTQSYSCTAGNETTLSFDIPDISVDQFGNSVSRAVYADLYITNNSGILLYDPIHILVE